ncbi:uncharacterized protein LOC144748866 [Ciona intestinalis]
MISTFCLMFLVLAVAADTACAIRCYQCETSTDNRNRGCEKGYLDSEYETECPDGLNYCETTTTTSYCLSKITSVTTTRNCTSSPKSWCFNVGCNSESCRSTCKTDLCNDDGGAMSITAGKFLITTAMLVPLFMQRFMS